MVDGPSAAALGTLARDRWRALGKTSLPRLRKPDTSLWPEHVPPDLLDVDVMIARTMPGVEDDPEVRENEALFFDAIRAAERTIYLESQYFTNSRIADALADRLREPDGPEVILVSPKICHGWLEQQTVGAFRIGSLPAAAGRGSVQAAASRLSRGIARAGRADVRALQGDDRRRHVRAHRVGEHLQSFHGRGHRVRRGRRSRRQRADALRHPAHPRSAGRRAPPHAQCGGVPRHRTRGIRPGRRGRAHAGGPVPGADRGVRRRRRRSSPALKAAADPEVPLSEAPASRGLLAMAQAAVNLVARATPVVRKRVAKRPRRRWAEFG